MTSNIAFTFPGQGSQSLGMLSKLVKKYPIIKNIFEQAADILKYNLWDLCQDGPIETLNRTQYTQPALLVAGYALWEAWQLEHEDLPVVMAGHSLGEYTALVCAKSIPFDVGLLLVEQRSKLMQNTSPQGNGAMAAILGLNSSEIEEICKEAAQQEIVSPANFNSPGQIVIAGHSAAVARAIKIAKAVGAKRAIMLPVSIPSHCELMCNAADNFADILYNIPFKVPLIPVIHNADVLTHDVPTAIQRSLVIQMYKPVRWIEIITKMKKSYNIQKCIECGPGKVLTGLNKRIERNLDCYSLDDFLLGKE